MTGQSPAALNLSILLDQERERNKALQAQVEKLEAELAELQARIQAAIEVYAGMDGFIPETAAEGYCLRIIEQMNEALQEQTP